MWIRLTLVDVDDISAKRDFLINMGITNILSLSEHPQKKDLTYIRCMQRIEKEVETYLVKGSLTEIAELFELKIQNT